jgi:MFS family permease
MRPGERGGPFAYGNFRLLFGARTASLVGTAMAPVGLSFAVLAATGSTTDLGVVLAARIAPFAFFLLSGGVLADRLPRQLVMVAADTVCGVAQLATGVMVLAGSHSLPWLVALQFLAGAANAFFFPAAQGLLPHTVSAEVFPKAFAYMGLSRNFASIVGGALGGFIAAVTSPGWTLVADAVTFAISAALTVGLRVPHLPPPPATMLGDLREGWQEFRSRTWLWAIVAQFAVVVGFGRSAQLVLGPVIAKAHLGGPAAWGWILSVNGAGSVVAAFLLVHRRRKISRPLLVASIGILVDAGILLALYDPLALGWLLLFSFLGGLGEALFGVMWETTMAREIPPQALSRVSAYDAMGSFLLQPIGLAVMGPLVAVTGVHGGLLIGAAAVVVPTLAVMCVRDVFRRRDPI